MFEKSKSAITFKEFEDKLNMVNNFESDWGHFYDTDYNMDDKNSNNINNVFKEKINRIPKVLKKKYFVDIEKKELLKVEKYNYEYGDGDYKNETSITIIRSFLDVIQLTFITLTMGYFIFKII